MEIRIPYVGQGDATLMVFPNGKTLLVDAGPPGAGKDYLLPLFEELGVKVINALVISHYDLDHLGGVPELPLGKDGIGGTSDDIKIEAAYDRGGQPWDEAPGYAKYLATLEQAKIPRRSLAAGDKLALDPNVGLRCLAANGVVGDGDAKPIAIDISPPTYAGRENAASIALLVEFEGFRYLTAGDLTGGEMGDGFLTPDVETALAELVGEVDALHVNHHGSLSSSNEAFVAATHPEAALIQAGIDNRYNHPAPDIEERWQAIGTEVYSTEDGRGIFLAIDGKDPGLRINDF